MPVHIQSMFLFICQVWLQVSPGALTAAPVCVWFYSHKLCCQIDGWTLSLHRLREEEEGDGWEGVDDTSGVRVCTRGWAKENSYEAVGNWWSEKKVLYTLFFLSSCAMFFSPFLKTQVAERNKTQISSRAVARRSGLLCPVWQETKAVSRCDEGTAASECCSLLTSMIQKQMFWSIPMSSWVNKDYSENHCGRHGLWFIWKNIFANNCNTAHPRCSNKCLCIRICCVLSMLSLQLQSTPLPLPCFLWT